MKCKACFKMRAPAKIYLTNERVPYRVVSFENNTATCEKVRGRKRHVIILNFRMHVVIGDNYVKKLDIEKVIFNSKI